MQATSLENKVILITGATRGIGEATAKALDQLGATLLLVGREKERLQTLADSLGDAVAIQGDLCQEGAIESLTNTAKRYGPIYGLVQSAGVARNSSVLDGDTAQWETMWRINVMALASVAQAILPLMPDSGGHVIHLGSMSGTRVPPSGGFYACTKFAVRGLTEALRLELRAAGNPTRVTLVSPGFVETDMAAGYLADRGQRIEDLGYDILQAEDVAQTIAHAMTAPAHVDVNEINLRSARQSV